MNIIVDSEVYFKLGQENHRMKSALNELLKIDLNYTSIYSLPYTIGQVKAILDMVKKDPYLKYII